MHWISIRRTFAVLLSCLAITSVCATVAASGQGAEYTSPATKRARRFVRPPTAVERAGLLLLVRRHRHDPSYFSERHSRLAGLCVSREDPRLATVVLTSPHADEFINTAQRRSRYRWRNLAKSKVISLTVLQHLTEGTLVAACGRHT
jgi:hypothetical protein